MAENDSWAIVELMGHVALAGRVTKPGEYGGLWQIDIPDGEKFRTEFFGSQSVYRIRIVSEEIARAYAKPAYDIVEYDAPIVTRAEHENAMQRAREQYDRVLRENAELSRRLTAVNALPSGKESTKYPGVTITDLDADEDDDEPDSISDDLADDEEE
jgi:hypothetical protein